MVYQTLRDSPGKEVLCLHSDARGTSVLCGLYEVASFLASLSRTSKVAVMGVSFEPRSARPIWGPRLALWAHFLLT